MSVYERFGVKPNINVSEFATRYGGSLMGKMALEAMNEAAKESVRLDELQVAASKVIAGITHAEAGIVTTGTSAALTLGTAACIAGFDVAKMNRLPDTTGMPNEVIMPWHQISGYMHAIRAAGARIIGAGMPPGTTPPEEVHIISGRDIESAVTSNTVAIAYLPRPRAHPPLEDVIEIGRRYKIPIIIDAANEVPPIENLHRFIDMGADLVCCSGGKGIRGPQAAGILFGRRELVASALIQMVDAGTFYEWNPVSLVPMEKLHGMPEHGIGRGMKATKEAIVGLLVALQNLTEEGFAEESQRLRGLLESIERQLDGMAGVKTRITEGSCGYPVLEVAVDEQVVGKSATEIAQRLEDGKPSIYANHKYLQKGVIFIHSLNMNEEIARVVGERLCAVMTS